ncbi:MAG: biotin--[acetyl-CoA-carboxylase] ligase [Treponema sp.]|nr:biotin--[acetyl-CoA-carboxylase] ligase [Treponema sp.]
MKPESKLSSKAALLCHLRENQGKPISGTVLAKKMEISRVAVWKAVQALVEAGYAIETKENGYLLDPNNEKDFLYPWEFGEKENLFYHYVSTTSVINRARELAFRGMKGPIVIAADRQTAGRGRFGKTWISKQGGLYFAILEHPHITVSDYAQFSLVLQIAVTKSISSICGKTACLRWPNDVYVDNRKIASITTEVLGEGDKVTWLISSASVNVNNKCPTVKAVSCSEITGHEISRKELLLKILDEITIIKKHFFSTAVYSQGNSALADKWNSLTDCIGAKAAVFEPASKGDSLAEISGKTLARGTFEGIDPAGRCILKTKNGILVFNQGLASLALLNNAE